ncbi:MAG: hypothetical protein ACYCWE_12525 [Eubacteriales bacterium]
MKQISTLLCFLILLSTVLYSCSGTNNKPADTVAVSSAAPEPTEEELRNSISDDLPDTDCEGREFRLYAFGKMEKFFFADEQDGEIINDSIYLANKTVEERFNTDIVYVDSGGNDTSHNSAIRTSILANDNAFEVAENHDSLSGASAMEGLYLNLYEIPYLNFEKPWWPSNAVESLTFMDQMYVGSSNMSYKGFHFTRVLFFNKTLISDYNLTEPYQYVFDGDWTLDMLIGITKDIYEDVNGDTKADKNDIYGYMANNPSYCYLEAYGINSIEKTDSELVMAINNQKTVTLFEKMYTLIFESAGGIMVDYSESAVLFGEGHAVYVFGELGHAVDTLRYTDVNYGIVPLPKLDDTQAEYLSAYTDRFFVVPVNMQDLEFIGLLLEAMSAEGYKKVIPAYYEVALKQKFTYDDESVQILELINEVRILDFAFVYCNNFNGIVNELLNPLRPSKDFASLYAKREKTLASSVAKVSDIFVALAES